MLKTNTNILIAEDNEDDVFILQHCLAKAGLTRPVHVCPDGEDVIHYLRAEGRYADREKYPFPRALILDLKMPRRDGLEVLRWIRAHPECAVIPIIILTASQEPKDVTEAYRLGANAYLVKPSRPEEFEPMLRLLYQFWDACVLPEMPQN